MRIVVAVRPSRAVVEDERRISSIAWPSLDFPFVLGLLPRSLENFSFFRFFSKCAGVSSMVVRAP